MSPKLGEGIAKVEKEDIPVQHCGIKYFVNKEDKNRLKMLGMAVSKEGKEPVPGRYFEPGNLIIHNGEIWKNDEGVSVKMFNTEDLVDVKNFIKENKESTGLYGLEDLKTGREIIIKEVKHAGEGNISSYQIWLARNPDDHQILLDSLCCLHFDEPAEGKDGGIMSPDEILSVAKSLGDTFNISPLGYLYFEEDYPDF